MCVIIDRSPGVTIPDDKMELACKINKHGFGLSFIVNETLNIIRSIEDNDPEKVQRLLHEHKDKRVFLHLRHATVGDVTLDNSHPIEVLSKKYKDKMDLCLMHNGTLYDFKPKEKEASDTLCFAGSVVEPLAKRSIAFLKQSPLLDDFFISTLKDYAESSNVFLIFDNLGNVVRINESKGKSFEGWWASNEYSFQSSHWRATDYTPFRGGAGTQTTTTTHYGGKVFQQTNRINSRGGIPGTPFRDKTVTKWVQFDQFADDCAGLFGANSSSSTPPTVGWTPTTSTNNRTERALSFIGKFVQSKRRDNHSMADDKGVISHDLRPHQPKDLSQIRKGFFERSGIKDWNDLTKLGQDDFIALCKNYPEGMAELFIDMAMVVKCALDDDRNP